VRGRWASRPESGLEGVIRPRSKITSYVWPRVVIPDVLEIAEAAGAGRHAAQLER